MFTVIGIISFLLYYLYDLNMVFFKTKAGNLSFTAGSFLLASATIGLVVDSARSEGFSLQAFSGLSIAFIFLLLLIYTLFFALPAKETYVDISYDRRPTVCRDGMYALCRHPGVLWLILMYAGLYLAYPNVNTLTAWIVFSVLDLLYILLQDLVIFPKQFSDYADYKTHTPFLIPNRRSIKMAWNTRRKDR